MDLSAPPHSIPLQGVPFIPFTASHVTQGTDLHVTLRHRQGVGFMGGAVTNK